MSIMVSDLENWLSMLKPDAEVAIDEGGLVIVEVGGDAYLEVGGIPDGDDEDSDA